MLVEVQLFATLRKTGKDAETAGICSTNLPEGSSIADLIRIMGIPPAWVHLTIVNGVSVGTDRVLQDGDRVGLFPMIGGG